MKKWIIGILAALLVGGGGFGLYQVFNDGYVEQPGVVYDNDGDGHNHDHPDYGISQ